MVFNKGLCRRRDRLKVCALVKEDGSRIEPKTHNGITSGSDLSLALALITPQIEYKPFSRLSHIGTAFAL